MTAGPFAVDQNNDTVIRKSDLAPIKDVEEPKAQKKGGERP